MVERTLLGLITEAEVMQFILQRLDPLGNKMWAPTGLLISNNQQSSSLVDWDLTC